MSAFWLYELSKKIQYKINILHYTLNNNSIFLFLDRTNYSTSEFKLQRCLLEQEVISYT